MQATAFTEPHPFYGRGFLDMNRFGIELLLYGFAFTGIPQFKIRAQRDAMRSLELQTQLPTAHLRVLQMQLESHSLLNTVNTISVPTPS